MTISPIDFASNTTLTLKITKNENADKTTAYNKKPIEIVFIILLLKKVKSIISTESPFYFSPTPNLSNNIDNKGRD